MVVTSNNHSKSYYIFQFFKYLVYCLLAYNIVLFFQDDYRASETIFKGGVALGDVVEAFSATVDTSAWVLLLLLFELETYIISDEKIRGAIKWSLHIVRSLCYVFIIYAFWGYINKLLLLLDVSVMQIDDVCNLVDNSFAYIFILDNYPLLTVENCTAFNGIELFRVNGVELIASSEAMANAQRLAWADVINAAAWLLVVVILEVDVFLQLRGGLTGLVRTISKWIKVVLYSVLFVAAVYWGFDGEFLDFWDAFLWLVAFIFIELNIFQWSEDLQEEQVTA